MEKNGRDLSGKFAPGHAGFKRKGRPEMQRATREKLWRFFEEKADQLPQVYDKLTDNQKAKLLLSVAEFFLPKTREILFDTENLGAAIDYTKLSEKTLKEILQHTSVNDNGETEQ